ncbi:hypothetical protein niasHT_028712 [Heterodera trifolii]|uniref:Uncharacterized protein n=1 Tax=Heterodera trifolii TaxID=157864 RepID=A0ABD2KSP3_9BILA
MALLLCRRAPTVWCQLDRPRRAFTRQTDSEFDLPSTGSESEEILRYNMEISTNQIEDPSFVTQLNPAHPRSSISSVCNRRELADIF